MAETRKKTRCLSSRNVPRFQRRRVFLRAFWTQISFTLQPLPVGHCRHRAASTSSATKFPPRKLPRSHWTSFVLTHYELKRVPFSSLGEGGQSRTPTPLPLSGRGRFELIEVRITHPRSIHPSLYSLPLAFYRMSF